MDFRCISVIVPIYNTAQYLDRCVKSITNQTYKNIEIILVDDGSTDLSGSVCDEYAKRNNRIQVIHQKNSGVSVARNCGLEQAKGEFLAFVDSDDWVDERYLETLAEPMLRDDEIDISCMNWMIERETYGSINKNGREETYVSKNDRGYLFLTQRLIGWAMWGKLYRKCVFEGFQCHENLLNSEDTVDNWCLIHRARKIYYIPTAYYHYVDRIDGASGRIPMEPQRRLDRLTAFYLIAKNVQYPPQGEAKTRIQWMIVEEYRRLVRQIVLLKPLKGQEMFNKCLDDYLPYIKEFVSRWESQSMREQFFRLFLSGRTCEEFSHAYKEQESLYRGGICVYGAGVVSRQAVQYLNKIGKHVENFIVGDGRPLGASPDGIHCVIHVSEIDEGERSDMTLLMGIDCRNADQVWEMLREKGFRKMSFF